MSDKKNLAPDENSVEENELISRREFFVGLKKWSKVVIGSAIAGSAVANTNQEARPIRGSIVAAVGAMAEEEAG